MTEKNSKRKKNPEEKQKERPEYSMWQNSVFMLHIAWRVRKRVIFFCVALAILGVATNLAELYITPAILSKVETTAPLEELITTILFFALTLLLLAAVTAYINANTLFGRIDVRGNIVNQINYKAGVTSYPNTENAEVRKKMDKANRATNSNQEATEAIWNTFTGILRNLTGFAIYLFLLSSLDSVLIAVVLATTITGYFVSKKIDKWGFNHREEEAGYENKLAYVSNKSEDTALAKDIRIFGMRTWLEDIHNSTMNLYQAFALRREKHYFIGNLLDVILTFLRNGIAYFYLISMVLNNGLSASQFLLYFTAIGSFTTWVTGILSDFSTLHRQSLDISTVREYLDTPEPFLFEDGASLTANKNEPYEIQLKNVSFRYPEAEKDTIHDMNLTLHAGEKLAVVGLNGAGKTTLVKLICGFYDPTEGEVLLNGVNIKKYNRRDYYRMFSAVFQNFSLLSTTIAENVTQTVDDIDYDKLEDCLKKSGLYERINALQDKSQTHVTKAVFEDGIELSGGETQRLMLARALYKDAPVIVLDEPTAALDPIAENDIYLKYNEMTSGRSSVYISHRLASTRFCDRIIFLADGGIKEEGTHESLMALNGIYADLFRVQSKYYQPQA